MGWILTLATILILVGATGATAGFICRLLARPHLKIPYQFTDAQDRIITYRGVNVCNYSKYSPDFLPWHTEQDYARLSKWGFNLVRFQVFWEAIEPEMGKYNTAYLEKVVEHIKMMKKHDIDVIIDVHQDLYSRKYGGNGFPEWAIKDKGKKFKPQKEWYMGYLQPAPQEAAKNFWKDSTLQDRYIKMLHVLYDYVESMNNVIGIDIINEPFPPLPGIIRFERKILRKFYDKVYYSFSIINKRFSIFVEPWMSTSAGLPSYLIGLYSRKNLKYIPHYYPPFCHTKGKYRKIDRCLMKKAMRMRAAEAEKMRSPLIFGEYGIDNKVKGNLQFVTDFLDECMKYQASCIWWTYDMDKYSGQGIIDESKQEKPVLKALMDIYPQKISGTDPRYWVEGSTFHLTYTANNNISPTVVYVPEHFSIEVSTNMRYEQYKNTYLFYGFDMGKKSISITIKGTK